MDDREHAEIHTEILRHELMSPAPKRMSLKGRLHAVRRHRKTELQELTSAEVE